MNYEIAKKLKEAGFPLVAASVEDGNDSKRKNQIFYYGKDDYGRDGSWLYPTLEELIEACGKTGFTLRDAGKDVWEANGGDSIEYFKGSTPDIAVANLYLALHPSE